MWVLCTLHLSELWGQTKMCGYLHDGKISEINLLLYKGIQQMLQWCLQVDFAENPVKHSKQYILPHNTQHPLLKPFTSITHL